jgi:hypothetical protein
MVCIRWDGWFRMHAWRGDNERFNIGDSCKNLRKCIHDCLEV